MPTIEATQIHDLVPYFGMIGYKNYNEYYFESYEIKNNIPGPATAVTEEFLQEISKTFSDRILPAQQGLLPKELIYWDPLKIIQIYKFRSQKWMLDFDPKCKIKKGKYQLPEIVIKIQLGGIYLFAVYKNKLYQVPLPNIGNTGMLCTGSINYTFTNQPYKDIEMLKKVVFKTKFNMDNFKNRHEMALNNLYSLKEDEFKIKLLQGLIPARETFKQFVEVWKS
jgi:hypothetical protein